MRKAVRSAVGSDALPHGCARATRDGSRAPPKGCSCRRSDDVTRSRALRRPCPGGHRILCVSFRVGPWVRRGCRTQRVKSAPRAPMTRLAGVAERHRHAHRVRRRRSAAGLDGSVRLADEKGGGSNGIVRRAATVAVVTRRWACSRRRGPRTSRREAPTHRRRREAFGRVRCSAVTREPPRRRSSARRQCSAESDTESHTGEFVNEGIVRVRRAASRSSKF